MDLQKNAELKKKQFLKRLLDKNFDKLFQGMNKLRLWSKSIASKKADKQKMLKEICRRFANQGLRQQGQALRQLRHYLKTFKNKLTGICKRLTNKNTRLMLQGYNQLKYVAMKKSSMLKDKLRFVIKSLKDKDSRYKLMAYNG